MKIVVTGGRDYSDKEFLFQFLDELHKETPIALLIHGACGWNADYQASNRAKSLRGADGLAEEWAQSRGVPIKREPAHWTQLGGAAGPIRNGKMLDYKPDLVVAFPGGSGTQNCVVQAFKRNIVVCPALKLEPDPLAFKMDPSRFVKDSD